jgi:hypothetical protein
MITLTLVKSFTKPVTKIVAFAQGTVSAFRAFLAVSGSVILSVWQIGEIVSSNPNIPVVRQAISLMTGNFTGNLRLLVGLG